MSLTWFIRLKSQEAGIGLKTRQEEKPPVQNCPILYIGQYVRQVDQL